MFQNLYFDELEATNIDRILHRHLEIRNFAHSPKRQIYRGLQQSIRLRKLGFNYQTIWPTLRTLLKQSEITH